MFRQVLPLHSLTNLHIVIKITNWQLIRDFCFVFQKQRTALYFRHIKNFLTKKTASKDCLFKNIL